MSLFYQKQRQSIPVHYRWEVGGFGVDWARLSRYTSPGQLLVCLTDSSDAQFRRFVQPLGSITNTQCKRHCCDTSKQTPATDQAVTCIFSRNSLGNAVKIRASIIVGVLGTTSPTGTSKMTTRLGAKSPNVTSWTSAVASLPKDQTSNSIDPSL